MFIEIFLVFIGTSIWLSKEFYWDLLTVLVFGIVVPIAVSALLFQVRLFRYVFAAVISVFWGAMACYLVGLFSEPNFIPWLVFGMIMAASLNFHKDYFTPGFRRFF